MYILNGKTYKEDEKTISPTSQAFMFGYGLFETLKVKDGKILFFEEHFKRLIEGADTIKMKFGTKKTDVLKDCKSLLDLKDMQDGVLKISYAKDDGENYLLLTTRESSYTDDDYSKGFKIMFSDLRRNQNSLLTYVKSNNYMENILEKQRSKEKGFDEVLFLNTDNFVAEGAVSNVFWIKNGVAYTPSVDCGLLDGIVRGKVLTCLKRLDISFKTGEFTKSDILDAEEVFITNSVMDIMPVCEIEEKTFDIEKNSFTKKIIEEYNMIIGEEYE